MKKPRLNTNLWKENKDKISNKLTTILMFNIFLLGITLLSTPKTTGIIAILLGILINTLIVLSYRKHTREMDCKQIK